jgi:hypothetical protein
VLETGPCVQYFRGERRSSWAPEKADDLVRQIVLITVVCLLPTGALADLMKCRQSNGNLYVGTSPPPDCGPVSNARERGPADSAASNERAKPRPMPTVAPTRKVEE